MTGQSKVKFSEVQVAELKKLLAQQVIYYRELEGYSKDQGDMVARGDTESLISLLGSRQKVLDRLGAIADQMAVYRASWQDLWDGLGENDRKLVGGLVDASEDLLKGIIERDELDKANLSAAKDAIENQVQKTQNRGAAMNAYQNQARGVMDPRFTDRKG